MKNIALVPLLLSLSCGTPETAAEPNFGASSQALPPVDNLVWNGGTMFHNPKVYVTFWGSDWTTGVGTAPADTTTASNYIITFWQRMGGSPWMGTQSQYCSDAAVGDILCAPGSANFTNPTDVFQGWWFDDSDDPPASVNRLSIEWETQFARDHFGAYDSESILVIYTPPGVYDALTATGGSACAWHSGAETEDGAVPAGHYAYIYIPWLPSKGAGCGANLGSPTDDLFGHGILDGFSKASGHEFAETVTDPFYGNGWTDSTGLKGENGDKCNANAGVRNVGFGGANGFFAVQPLWSNAAGGCDLGSTPAVSFDATSYNFGTVEVAMKTTAQPFVVKNTGNADLKIDFAAASGANPGDYWIYEDDCAGKTLRPSSDDTCVIWVMFVPWAFGARSAALSVFSNAPLMPFVTLTGNGTLQRMGFLPNAVQLLGTLVGTSSSAVVRMVNLGSKAQLISAARLVDSTRSFSMVGDQCTGATLLPKASCIVNVQFTPRSTAAVNAFITVQGAGENKPWAVRVKGKGEGPEGQLSSTALAFDDVLIGASAAQTVTVRSIGRAALSLGNIVSSSGDFTVANGCPQSIATGSSCTLTVTFRPSATLQRGGTIIVNTNGRPLSLAVGGEGQRPQGVIDAGRLGFAGRPGTKSVRFLNAGAGTLHVTSVSVTGDFSVVHNCALLAAGAQCSLNVTYLGTHNGNPNGSLFISDDGWSGQHVIPLYGQPHLAK